MIKNFLETMSHKVYEVPPNPTTHQIEWFHKGVWGISVVDEAALAYNKFALLCCKMVTYC